MTDGCAGRGDPTVSKGITFATDVEDLLSGSIRQFLKDCLTGQAQGGTLVFQAAQTLPAVGGGSLALGANVDGGDHRARIGIYSAFGLTGPLEEVVVPVVGYGGVDFAFPVPVSVSSGRTYYVTASGVGDFTAYDNRSGCFIGELDGFS